MKELKFKNSKIEAIACACVCSVVLLIFLIIFLCTIFIGKEEYDLKRWLVGFSITLFVIWLIAGIAIIFSKTVVITSTEIKLLRGNKEKWCIKKEEIEECIYNKMKWYNFLDPISTINSFSLQFRLQKNGKISSRCYCLLSQKQINKIKENFDYPIREISTIYEQ